MTEVDKGEKGQPENEVAYLFVQTPTTNPILGDPGATSRDHAIFSGESLSLQIYFFTLNKKTEEPDDRYYPCDSLMTVCG